MTILGHETECLVAGWMARSSLSAMIDDEQKWKNLMSKCVMFTTSLIGKIGHRLTGQLLFTSQRFYTVLSRATRNRAFAFIFTCWFLDLCLLSTSPSRLAYTQIEQVKLCSVKTAQYRTMPPELVPNIKKRLMESDWAKPMWERQLERELKN